MEELATKGQMQRERRGFDLRDELSSSSIGPTRWAQRCSEQGHFLYLKKKKRVRAALPFQKRHTFTCRRLSFSQHKLDTLLPYASPNPLSFYASPNLLSCSQSLQNLQMLPCSQLSFSLALQNRDTLLPYESRKNIRFSQVIFLLPISK